MPNKPWYNMNVHMPPNKTQRVNTPCDSGPQRSNREWLIQLAGVDTADVIKLQPSRYELDKPCVN